MDWVSAPNIEDAPLPLAGRGAWLGKFDRARDRLEAFLEAERGQLPLWAVAAFGAGIALWFDPAGEWTSNQICDAFADYLVGGLKK
jgi:hypothetical protein